MASHYCNCTNVPGVLTLLHSEKPKLHTILAFLSAIGLMFTIFCHHNFTSLNTHEHNVVLKEKLAKLIKINGELEFLP